MNIKKLKLTSILLALALILSQSVTLIAQTVETTTTTTSITTEKASEYAFTYELNYYGEGIAIVDLPTDYKGELVIPKTIDGKPVTRIGSSAFLDCVNLTSVTIPDSVTIIEPSAFANCYNLKSVTLPNSVTKIEHNAFYHCENLESITIPKSVTSIGYQAFFDCHKLANITMSTEITTIGYQAFYGTAWHDNHSNGVEYLSNWVVGYKGDMPEHTDLIIKDGIVGIEDYAFADCKGLEHIELPESVVNIGYKVFYHCFNLKSISIPHSVTSIDDYAFFHCYHLEHIEIPKSVTYIGESAFEDCDDLQSIEIPNSVTTIGDFAFEDCDSLANVTIPNSVTSIGECAFEHCEQLKSIVIPDSVTSIGEHAFYLCPDLTIYINSDNKYIRQYAKDNGIPCVIISKPLKPTNIKATALSTEVIKVTWNKVSSADGYEVYRVVNGKSVFYKTLDKNTTSFNNSGKKANTTYSYKMRAYKVIDGKKLYSGYTDLVTCTTPSDPTLTKPLKPTGIKATAQSTSTIKVVWNKVSNADGYEVYRVVNGKSVFYKTLDKNTTSFNNAGKKANTTYSYKMRAYTSANGKKIYSDYTNLFTCTTPKK